MIHAILQFFSTKLAEIQTPSSIPTFMLDLLSGFEDTTKSEDPTKHVYVQVPWYNIYLLALGICCVIIATEYLIITFIHYIRPNIVRDRRMIGRYRYNCEGESVDGHRCKRRMIYSTKCSQHRVE